MKTSRLRGFTIVEIMLFLAVSGVMIAVLLGGWTVMINTQRYKDSVDTVYAYLQDQYNLVYNVENGRPGTLNCDASAQITETGASAPDRGQSDCVLMGRYVRLMDGRELESYAIVGREPADPAGGSDSEVITDYNPNVVDRSIGLTQTKLTVPWGATIVGSGNGTPRNLTFIIIRSPNSGTVHTYIVETGGRVDPQIFSSDVASDNEGETKLCVEPDAFIQGTRRAVVIRELASSQNSIETLGDNSGC